MSLHVSGPVCRRFFGALSRERLWQALDHFTVSVPDRRVTEGMITGLAQAADRVDLEEVLSWLSRKELQDICALLKVEAGGREKDGYRAKLVEHLRERAPASKPTATRATAPDVERGTVTRVKRATAGKASGGERVFIVHGHDDSMRLEIKQFIDKLGLKPIVLQDEPNSGLTVLEKLEKHRDEASFAIVLLSPDDMGYSRKDGPEKARARARQNVVLELGMMIGVLGRGHVAVLHHGNIEMPSDIVGLVYIAYERDYADSANVRIARELRNAGFDVDLNHVM